MKRIARVAVTSLLLLVSTARGHEGGADFRGVVVTAEAGALTVRGTDGKEHRAALTRSTRIFLAGRAAKASDLAPGLRVVVHAREAGDGPEAVTVQAAPAKTPAPVGPAR